MSSCPDVQEQVAGLAEHLRRMPSIPFEIDPATHYHLIIDYFLHALALFSPIPEVRQKAERLSKDTFGMVCLRAKKLHALQCVIIHLQLVGLHFTVKAWRRFTSNRCKAPIWCCVRGPQTQMMCQQQTSLTYFCRDMANEIPKASAADFAAMCAEQAVASEEAALEHSSQHV